MYTAFYDLKEKPFDLSPSPRFLYLGETHKEALAVLTYGVLERKGFVLLTGEVGTGKTTIVHALLAGLDQDVQLVHLSNPLISPREFLDFLARKALGREVPFESKAEFLIAFERFLGGCLQSGRNFLLIIDEAHKLSFELLEEIRLLSNMETAEEKLINIFLVGQPELRERLSHPRCRALFQRITIHYDLRPLDQNSVGEYIRTRLQVAGAKEPEEIFPKSVIKTIYRYSKGYPREINNLSDNVLLLGYVQGNRRITSALVTECLDYMTPDASQPEEDEGVRELPQARAAPEPTLSSHLYLSASALLILGVALGMAIALAGNNLLSRKADMMPLEKQSGAGLEGVPLKETEMTEPSPKNEEAENSEQGPLASDISPEMPPHLSDFESLAGHTSWRTVTVQEGDTLRELVLDVYGQGDQTTLDLVKKKNPAIENVNLILVGQRITFPPLSVPGNETDSIESGS
jgi:type II secretory pathway predicted ATPase ExeA